MPEATIAPPAAPLEDDLDPFKAKLFDQTPVAPQAPQPPPTPEPQAPQPVQPPAEPVAPTSPPPAPGTDERPRGADGKFLPKEAVAPGEPEKPAGGPPEAKEDLLGKLSRGEIDEMPAKPNGTNPGQRPAEGTEEFNTWKELRSAHQEAKRELETLRTQLKETQGKVPTDYEDLRKELEATRTREAARDVRMRPEFQQEIAIPIQNIGQQIENAIKDRGFNKGAIGEIINIEDDVERDTRLHDYLSGGDKPLPATTIARLGIQIERLRELRANGDEILKNAPQVIESLNAKEQEDKAKAAEQEKQLFEKGKGLVFQVFDSQFGDVMKNDKSRQEVENAAARDWNSLKPAQRALAMASPAMLQEYQNAMSVKIADYERRLEDSAKDNAGLRLQLQRLGGGGPTVDPVPPTPKSQEDPNADPFREKLMSR